MTARAFLALLGLLLLLPSANYQTFDGVPSSRLPEFLGLALLVPFVVSRALRRLYGVFLHGMPPVVRHGLVALGIGAVAAKLVLFASGTHAGFLACYRSPVAAPPAGPCELSYENPFARFGVTRIDQRIDFTPATWDLSFVNSLRFNIYPWITGNVRRDRLPLAATWSGTIERADAWTAEVTYVGTATIRVGSLEPLSPAPRYDALATAVLPIPAGRHRLRIDYEFDDGSRAGDGRVHGPYATFRLLTVPGPGQPAVPVVAVKPSRGWRGAAAAIDVVVVLFAVILAAACAKVLAPDTWVLAAVAVAAPAGYYFNGWLPPIVRGVWFFLLLALLFGHLVTGIRSRRLLASYVGIVAATSFFVRTRFDRFDRVGYRAAGDDWLTYESFARSILETGSLRGAENVFYYQPLFRYVRFAEHFLLGDGDPFILIAALVGLSWSLFWMFAAIVGRTRHARGRAVILSLAGLLLLLWASSPTVVNFIQTGISEYPTWIALPLLLPLLFSSSSTGSWMLGATLLGLSLLTRTNHVPAVLGMLAIFLWRGGGIRPRAAIAAGCLFGVIALLPGLHNYYYGGRLVPLTTSGGIPQNLVLPPARLLDVLHDAEIRGKARDQIARMLYVTDAPDRVLELAVRGIQTMWVLTVAAVLLGYRPGFFSVLLLGVPILYLVPHILYQATHGYPRHFLVGYLAMGAVVVLAWARHKDRSGPSRAEVGPPRENPYHPLVER